jgi:hypothetical protein
MTSTRPAPFGDYQLEIYLAGLHGTVPAFPMAYAELEARAAHALSPSVLSYVAGGAGSEHTQRANAGAFHQWGLIPRMFVGAAQRDLSVGLFGMTAITIDNGIAALDEYLENKSVWVELHGGTRDPFTLG